MNVFQKETIALTRRVFLAGAGATCFGAAVQTATLPSGGFWGDIGYALFKTFEDRAELTVRQTDFYFNRRWQEKPRPKNWAERVKMHDGRKVTFWYDKPRNFYS